MKNKLALVGLLVVSVVLGIGLILEFKRASEQQALAVHNLTIVSNTVAASKKEKEELSLVNQSLQTNLTTARMDFSNKLAQADAKLNAAVSNLEKVTAASQAQIKSISESNAAALAERDRKISDLESRNALLDSEANSLRTAITNLDVRIADTEGKLARSEGDRTFLTKELKTLKAEKENLLKRFNDIAAVREQLHKLKIEASLARRLQHERQAIDDSFKNDKGVLATEQPVSAQSGGAAVELRQSGGVRIEAPTPPPATNAPPK